MPNSSMRRRMISSDWVTAEIWRSRLTGSGIAMRMRSSPTFSMVMPLIDLLIASRAAARSAGSTVTNTASSALRMLR